MEGVTAQVFGKARGLSPGAASRTLEHPSYLIFEVERKSGDQNFLARKGLHKKGSWLFVICDENISLEESLRLGVGGRGEPEMLDYQYQSTLTAFMQATFI